VIEVDEVQNKAHARKTDQSFYPKRMCSISINPQIEATPYLRTAHGTRSSNQDVLLLSKSRLRRSYTATEWAGTWSLGWSDYPGTRINLGYGWRHL